MPIISVPIDAGFNGFYKENFSQPFPSQLPARINLSHSFLNNQSFHVTTDRVFPLVNFPASIIVLYTNTTFSATCCPCGPHNNHSFSLFIQQGLMSQQQKTTELSGRKTERMPWRLTLDEKRKKFIWLNNSDLSRHNRKERDTCIFEENPKLASIPNSYKMYSHLYQRRRVAGMDEQHQEDSKNGFVPKKEKEEIGSKSKHSEDTSVISETLRRKIQAMLLLRHGTLGCLVNSLGEEYKTFFNEEIYPKLSNHKNWAQFCASMPNQMSVRIQKGYRVAFPKPLAPELVGDYSSTILRRFDYISPAHLEKENKGNIPALIRRRIRLMLLFRNRGIGCSVDEVGREYASCFGETLECKSLLFQDWLELLKEMKDEVDIHTVKGCKVVLARPLSVEETQRSLQRILRTIIPSKTEQSQTYISRNYGETRHHQQSVIMQHGVVDPDKDRREHIRKEIRVITKSIETARSAVNEPHQVAIETVTSEKRSPVALSQTHGMPVYKKACGCIMKVNVEYQPRSRPDRPESKCPDCKDPIPVQSETHTRRKSSGSNCSSVENRVQNPNTENNKSAAVNGNGHLPVRSNPGLAIGKGDDGLQRRIIFRTQVVTLNEGILNVVAYNVSHDFPEGEVIDQPPVKMKDTCQEYVMWDTIQTVKKHQQETEVETIRLRPESPSDEEAYQRLFSLLADEHRVGILDTLKFPKHIKSMYLAPWQPGREIHKLLEPISGPGLEEDGFNSILCIIIRSNTVWQPSRDSGSESVARSKRSRSRSRSSSPRMTKVKLKRHKGNTNPLRKPKDYPGKDWIETRTYGYVCFPREVSLTRRVKVAGVDSNGKIMYPNGPCKTHPEDICGNCRQLGHTIRECWNEKFVAKEDNNQKRSRSRSASRSRRGNFTNEELDQLNSYYEHYEAQEAERLLHQNRQFRFKETDGSSWSNS